MRTPPKCNVDLVEHQRLKKDRVEQVVYSPTPGEEQHRNTDIYLYLLYDIELKKIN